MMAVSFMALPQIDRLMHLRADDLHVRDRLAKTVGEPHLRRLLAMHEQGFRHMPVVENGAPVGIVSSRSALDPEMEEFTAETQRRLSLR